MKTIKNEFNRKVMKFTFKDNCERIKELLFLFGPSANKWGLVNAQIIGLFFPFCLCFKLI